MSTSIIPVRDVKYFAFAGGGGKGIVLLGAVQALEGLLTVPVAKARKVEGFAGASAGALVAMMLALHYDSRGMRNALQKWLGRSSTDIPWAVADAAYRTLPSGAVEKVPDKEEGWLNILKRRVVVNGRYQALSPNDKVIGPVLKEIRRDLYIRESLANDPHLRDRLYQAELGQDIAQGIFGGTLGGVIGKGVLGAVHPLAPFVVDTPEAARRIYSAARDALQGSDFAFLTRTRDEFDRYVCNALLDQGLVPGTTLRNSVHLIARASPLLSGRLSALEVASLTFAQLFELAQVDLVVTGTNLGTSTWSYFSRRHTPDFPVVDAVALSMTYPILFKPVWLDGRKTPPEYRGNWVDGGMLNNLPVHAFDPAPDRPLDHRTVAFAIADVPDYGVAVTGHDMLVKNISSLLDVLLNQSTLGQLRTPLERAQTVFLHAPGLSTLDLVPQWVKADRGLIAGARAETERYFTPSKVCLDEVARWRRRPPEQRIDDLVFQEMARNQLRGAFVAVSPTPMTVRPYRNKGDVLGDRGFAVDMIATFDGDGVAQRDRHYVLYEAKSSATARLSPRQARAVQLLAEHGGYISTEKSEEDDEDYRLFPDKARVSAQAVRILRPANLCDEFTLAAAIATAAVAAKRPFRPDFGAQSTQDRGPGYPQL